MDKPASEQSIKSRSRKKTQCCDEVGSKCDLGLDPAIELDAVVQSKDWLYKNDIIRI